MHKSGISSIPALAVQLFFILKKKNKKNQTSHKHLVHSSSVMFSGLFDSLNSLVVCSGKCKTHTNP